MAACAARVQGQGVKNGVYLCREGALWPPVALLLHRGAGVWCGDNREGEARTRSKLYMGGAWGRARGAQWGRIDEARSAGQVPWGRVRLDRGPLGGEAESRGRGADCGGRTAGENARPLTHSQQLAGLVSPGSPEVATASTNCRECVGTAAVATRRGAAVGELQQLCCRGRRR